MEFVTAPDGVRLAVDETGNPDGIPVLFIHGFTQSATAWDRQFSGSLPATHRMVRFDMRGHGESDKPADPAAYTVGRRWADDIATLIRERKLERPILVGWSYGGFVICDYLRHYGSAGIRGIVLAGGATKKGTPEARPFGGKAAAPLWNALFDDDAAVWGPGLAAFADVTTARPLDAAFHSRILERNAQTPSHVRRALQDRVLDNDDVLAACKLPVLIVHGEDDGVVTSLAAEHHARTLPQARLVLYPGIGHMPFGEDPKRFDADLQAFAAELRERAS
ncbi:MAG: alpha/beta hydrolase [Candidatus Elarobacter sp.]